MKLEQIRPLAEGFIQEYNRYAERIVIGGSIRREKPDCRDIEIVCIPKLVIWRGLFGKEIYRSNYFFTNLKLNEARGNFKIVKGSGDCPKYVQLKPKEGPKIDLFFCTPENWGWILFLRTGPVEWNKKIIRELKIRGYISKDGWIVDNATGYGTVTTPEEIDIFKLLGRDYVAPKDRS